MHTHATKDIRTHALSTLSRHKSFWLYYYCPLNVMAPSYIWVRAFAYTAVADEKWTEAWSLDVHIFLTGQLGATVTCISTQPRLWIFGVAGTQFQNTRQDQDWCMYITEDSSAVSITCGGAASLVTGTIHCHPVCRQWEMRTKYQQCIADHYTAIGHLQRHTLPIMWSKLMLNLQELQRLYCMEFVFWGGHHAVYGKFELP
jgi:hypothetical protein